MDVLRLVTVYERQDVVRLRLYTERLVSNGGMHTWCLPIAANVGPFATGEYGPRNMK